MAVRDEVLSWEMRYGKSEKLFHRGNLNRWREATENHRGSFPLACGRYRDMAFLFEVQWRGSRCHAMHFSVEVRVWDCLCLGTHVDNAGGLPNHIDKWRVVVQEFLVSREIVDANLTALGGIYDLARRDRSD